MEVWEVTWMVGASSDRASIDSYIVRATYLCV